MKKVFETKINLVLSLFLICACSNVMIENTSRNNSYEYEPGYPELRVVTSSYIGSNDSTFLNIAGELIFRSLSFKKKGIFFISSGTINISIRDLKDEYERNIVFDFPIQIQEEDFKKTRSQESYFFDTRYSLKPGDYAINVTYIDDDTQKSTTRLDEVNIPNPKIVTSNSNVSDIRVLVKEKNEDEFKPITTYDIPNNIDSVKFLFQVTNINSSSPLVIRSRLVKFQSDTLAARLMNYRNYSTGSLRYKGIDYDDKNMISSSRRTLSSSGTISIEYVFNNFERGNYRIEIFSENDEDFYRAHDFGVKSPNYPTLRSAKELAAPLVYLMKEKDYEEMMSIKDDVELKRAVDRFWLSNIENRSKAKSTISLYYSRVEEANKQFSNFKEGWKTDQGMIYIFFGRPWNAENYLNTVRWGYSHNMNDFEKNYNFKAPKLKNKFFPFDNYIFERDPNYYNVQYQRIQLWLSGRILESDL